MSENNNEQFKMPPKRPRGPMGRGPGMVTEKARDFTDSGCLDFKNNVVRTTFGNGVVFHHFVSAESCTKSF